VYQIYENAINISLDIYSGKFPHKYNCHTKL